MSTIQFDRFLLFGDSITEFSFNSNFQPTQAKGKEPFSPIEQQFAFGAALTNTYVRKMEIVQRGFSGYNSRWALKLLPEILKDVSRVKLAYIFFGSNDSCLGGHQAVPLDEYVSNTEKLVEMLRAAGIKPILITPGMYNVDAWMEVQEEEIKKGYVRTLENFGKYAAALVELGSKIDVPVVDLNTAFKKYAQEKLDGKWQDLLCDGLHYTGHGSYVMYTELLKTISASYPELAPENLPYRFPNWRDVEASGDNL